MLIGADVPRIDGLGKLGGTARYVDDLAIEGVLHGGTIRSPIARGRIKGIHFDPALDWREYTIERWLAMRDYLLRTYPKGTPAEELDVDAKLAPDRYERPTVLDWWPGVPDEPTGAEALELWRRSLVASTLARLARCP